MAVSHMETAAMTRLIALYVLCCIDLVAILLLGLFALYHVRMVLCNATTMAPEGEGRYDVGALANWQQVFGRRKSLWALPLWLGDAPSVDGIHWPASEDADGEREAKAGSGRLHLPILLLAGVCSLAFFALVQASSGTRTPGEL